MLFTYINILYYVHAILYIVYVLPYVRLSNNNDITYIINRILVLAIAMPLCYTVYRWKGHSHQSDSFGVHTGLHTNNYRYFVYKHIHEYTGEVRPNYNLIVGSSTVER